MTANHLKSIATNALFCTATMLSPQTVAAQPMGVVSSPAPTGIVETATARLAVEFRLIQGSAVLLVSDADGKLPGTTFFYINSPDDALRFLADPRYSFLWKALTDWAGEDLGKLRDRYLLMNRKAMEEDAPGSARNTAESSTRPSTRAVLQYASALADTGNIDAARKLLLSQLPGMNLASNDGRSDWVLVRIRLAQLLARSGRQTEALETLAATPKEVRASGYALNMDVNRAAILAETGHYAEALQAIDAGQGSFKAYKRPKGERGARVSGSERQFAWIRACALHGLGREQEAQELIKSIDQSRPRPDVFVVQPNVLVLTRAYACMGDHMRYSDALLAEFANRQPIIGSTIIVQPAYVGSGSKAAFVKELHDDPRIKALAPKQVRILPPELGPALNHWQRGNGE